MEHHLILSQLIISKTKCLDKLVAANKCEIDIKFKKETLKGIWNEALLIRETKDETKILVITKEFVLYIFNLYNNSIKTIKLPIILRRTKGMSIGALGNVIIVGGLNPTLINLSPYYSYTIQLPSFFENVTLLF